MDFIDQTGGLNKTFVCLDAKYHIEAIWLFYCKQWTSTNKQDNFFLIYKLFSIS